MSKYGLDWLAHSDSPLRVLAWPQRLLRKEDHRSQPERARLVLEELGTTYIKLGQALSTRTDLVPPEYVAELAKLQDDAPEVPFAQIRQVILEELGEPPEAVFADFEREPLAAASIGQVHRARLEDGSRVVVKVQRPGTEAQVEKDLQVMRDVVRLLNSTGRLRDYDLEGWLDEFAFTLRNELDYRREGQNADRFRQNFAGDEVLRIPIVYWKYTTQRVLTMEEVGGIKITDVEALDDAGLSRLELAQHCARIVLTEIFDHGLFHADPHAGNFFVREDGKINLIDFGMVGQIDRETRERLMRITLAMSRQDADSVIEELLTLGYSRRPVNRQALRIELARIIQQHMESPSEEFSLAMMFQDTLRTAAEHHIRIQSDMLFLARSLAMAEGIGKVLDPEYRIMDSTRVHLERIYREVRSPEALADRAKENYVEIGEMALDLPKRIRRLAGQLERGEIRMNAYLGNAEELLEHFHRAVNRLSMAVVLAGVIAGLSVLSLSVRGGVAAFWLNMMLAVVIAGGLLLLVSFLRSRKPD